MEVPKRIEQLIEEHIRLQQDKLIVDREILMWMQDNLGTDLYEPNRKEKEIIDSLGFAFGCERVKEMIVDYIKQYQTEEDKTA